MKNETSHTICQSTKEMAKWIANPHFATRDEIVRESFIALGTISGGLVGLGVYSVAAGLKVFDVGTQYISQFVSGRTDVQGMMPQIVDSIFYNPIETLAATTALGIGISSYFAIVGKNTPPRDPDDWQTQVWDFDHSHRWR
jgi:hypothetical protein